MHKSLTEIAIEKIFPNDATLLSPLKKISSSMKYSAHKKNSSYENDIYVIFTIIAQIISILHYELLEIQSYQSFDLTQQNIVDFAEKIKKRVNKSKVIKLNVILDELLKSEKDLKQSVSCWNKVINKETKERIKKWLGIIGGSEGVLQIKSLYQYCDTIIIQRDSEKENLFRYSSLYPYLIQPTATTSEVSLPKLSHSVSGTPLSLVSKRSDSPPPTIPFSGDTSPMIPSVSSPQLRSPEKSSNSSFLSESPTSSKPYVFPASLDHEADALLAKSANQLSVFIESLQKIFSTLPGQIERAEHVADFIIQNSFITGPHMFLVFLTQTPLKHLDQIIHCSASKEVAPVEEVKTIYLEYMKEYNDLLKYKIEMIAVHKEKIERDELSMEFEDLAGRMYRKVLKELESVVGVWRKKEREKKAKKLYRYIADKYSRLLNRDPLFNSLLLQNKQLENFEGNFIKLDDARDSLNRAIRMIPSREEIEKNPCSHLLYKYLRQFILKKLLLMNFITSNKNEKHKLLTHDFMEFPLLFEVYKFQTLKFRAMSLKAKKTVAESSKDVRKDFPKVESMDKIMTLTASDKSLLVTKRIEAEDSSTNQIPNIVQRTSSLTKKQNFTDFRTPAKSKLQNFY